ncbi:MAG TPA: peptidylprolyl isomerase [Ferruginibacter sp.]|jgi:peptidyl-prolyl cis-trans isomerase B (cyclophilin B)|nr:peptidylprolyl isomerase [Ferruginibacter sp.]
MNKVKTLITFALVCFLATTVHAQAKKTTTKKATTQKTSTVKKTVKPIANAPKQVKVPGVRVKITTDSGVMIVRLYDKTPLHRDNFIKLANEHFFDSLLFHRVISQFMIQGGDPESKYAQPGQMLGSGGVSYTIPAEFDTSLIHKKGALAAARMGDQVNPTRASSGCQFYIVQGKTWTDQDLNNMEMQRGAKYTAAQRNIYKTLGGTPFLDMGYTVFGEVESGLEVVDKIASVQKGQADRPLTDVRMHIEVIK